MKFTTLVLTLLLSPVLSAQANAQTVNVKDLDASQESSTTIEIKKGDKTKSKWEVQEGDSEIEGESGATTKDAKAEWAKACKEWKKEFREDNKESKIISMNCGSANCTGDAGAKVCSSKATFKIKTIME